MTIFEEDTTVLATALSDVPDDTFGSPIVIVGAEAYPAPLPVTVTEITPLPVDSIAAVAAAPTPPPPEKNILGIVVYPYPAFVIKISFSEVVPPTVVKIPTAVAVLPDGEGAGSNVIIGATAQKADYVELMFVNGEWVGAALSSIDDAITTS